MTGGSRGIGAAICRELARGGAKVAVNYRSSREEAEAIAGEIGGLALEGDVSDPGQARDSSSGPSPSWATSTSSSTTPG